MNGEEVRCTSSAFPQGNKRCQLPSPGGLPALGFDSALQLVHLNQRALEVFFDRQDLKVPSRLDAEWFLGAGSDVRARLVLLAEKSQTTWGEGPTLQLWKSASLENGSRASFHAEVLVDDFTSSSETDLAFSLILLRPASPSRSAERPHSPTRTYSSSFTLAPPPTVGPLKPPPRSLSKSAHLVPALSKWKDEGVHTSTEELYRTLKIVTARVSAPSDTSAQTFSQSPVASVEGGANDTLMADGPTDPPAGNPASSAGQQQDDGLRDKGQRKLSFEELNRLMDTLPVIVFTSEASGQVDWFNKEWYRYTGLGHVESMDFANWAEMFHPDDLVTALPIWVNSMATGAPFKFEYRVKGADGTLRWSMCSGRSKQNPDGSIVSWACAITDIDELVQARQSFLQAKEHISAVLSGAELVLLSIDRENLVTFFDGSAAASRCLGQVTADGGLPSVGSRVVWPDDRLKRAVDTILAEEQPNVELLLDTVSDEGVVAYCRYRLVPLRSGPSETPLAITGVIVVCTDITHLYLAEEALRKAHNEQATLKASELAAKEASRLKTAFLTNLSHEIRTPIAGVLGILELLDTDATLAESHRSLVGKAIRSGELLLDLVGMVLDVRKIEAGELHLEEAPFELSHLIADAQLFSVAANRKDVNFIEDVGAFYQFPLLGDSLRIRQVLANALSNSVKFTRAGSITLRVRQKEETQTSINLMFEVEDTGVGIAKDILPTLFVPFRQADASTARNYGGSGLGLVIAKSLVEMMGGSIQLASTYGEGTTMTFHIPLKKAPFDKSSMAPSLASLPVTNQQKSCRRAQDVRVLLAEDNELIREIITRLLRKMNFEVEAVEDGAAAVQAASTGRFDVILMDGQMPSTDGYEATAQIRRSTDPAVRSVRIIALTASAIEGDRHRCISAGMDAYLAKPVRAKDLESAIWKELERS